MRKCCSCRKNSRTGGEHTKKAGTRCVPAFFSYMALACRMLQMLPRHADGFALRESGGSAPVSSGREPQERCVFLEEAQWRVPSDREQAPMREGTVSLTGLGKVCPVWAGVDYCFLMVSVEPMDALMMAVRAAHWARLSCSSRKRKPERAARAGSRLMRILNVREGRFLSAMISTP